MFPAFHEDEGELPHHRDGGWGRDRDGEVNGDFDEDDDDFDEGQPGAAPGRPPLTVEASAPMNGPQLLEGLMQIGSTTPSSPVDGSSPSPLVLSAFPVRSYANSSERELIHVNRKAEKALFALCLMYAKAATEPAPFGLRDSETLRRKQHALRLLLHVLHHVKMYFRQHISSAAVASTDLSLADGRVGD